MPSEKGHAKNAANFQTMIASVTGFGGGYNPGNAEIELSKLINKLTATNDAMDDVLTKYTTKNTDVNTRKDAYDQMKPLVRQVLAYYESSGADDNDIEDVRGFKRKIEGQRASKPKATPPAPGKPAKKQISSAQTGFVEKIEHLDGIIEKLSGDSHYKPNETGLQVATLKDYSALLKSLNQTVIDSTTAWKSAIAARDVIMYAKKTGLVDLADAVKKYVKGAFTASSAEYKLISKLRFTS